MATSFGSLYEYNINGGVVVPQTSSIKTVVENAFKEIFGSDFSTDATTANGRLIEAITMMFVDVCGVNAQNVKGLNVGQAIGVFLDNLGEAYGVERQTGETDYSYRSRIIESYSRGSGFASSIRNAVMLKSGVTKCVVLDNGYEDPSVLPLDDSGSSMAHSVAVKSHSVLISVLGGTDTDVASAIRSSKSAGCGFEDSASYGTVTSVTLTEDGTSFTAKFYRPTQRYVSVYVKISDAAYTGTDISADAIAAVRNLIESNSINSTITKSMVAAALASDGKSIITLETKLYSSDTNSTPTSSEEVDQIVIPAYKYAVGTTTTVTVEL